MGSDEDYILQFAQPFNRLELLQAHSCPEEITNHELYETSLTSTNSEN